MKKLFLMFLVLGLSAGLSWAVPTTVTVRAKSKDAKFIGSTMGGASVLIKNAETGEIMAKGMTTGGTGNTKMIMLDPVKRGTPISDNSTARFETTVDIDEPTFVTIEVSGPMGQKQSMAKSSTQVWLLPGKRIEGDGIMVEIPGFSVDVLAPQPHEMYKLSGASISVPIRANIVMM